MTIQEAIAILTQHQLGTDPLYLPNLPEAEKLAIEAMKRVRANRSPKTRPHWMMLPGETPDD